MKSWPPRNEFTTRLQIQELITVLPESLRVAQTVGVLITSPCGAITQPGGSSCLLCGQSLEGRGCSATVRPCGLLLHRFCVWGCWKSERDLGGGGASGPF